MTVTECYEEKSTYTILKNIRPESATEKIYEEKSTTVFRSVRSVNVTGERDGYWNMW